MNDDRKLLWRLVILVAVLILMIPGFAAWYYYLGTRASPGFLFEEPYAADDVYGYVYFSSVVITGLGADGIKPVSSVARLAVLSESFLGTMILVFVVAYAAARQASSRSTSVT